jgi:hypothetical protein
MAKNEATQVAPKRHFDFTSLNTLSVVSLATAVTGFGALAGIITGHISLAQLKHSGQSGRGLAIAGLALGYATIGFWIVAGIGMALLRFRYGFDGPMGPRGGMMGWGNN